MSTGVEASTDPLAVPPEVMMTRAESPQESPGQSLRGLGVHAPYNEAFIHDFKTTLPEWGRTWDGSAWIVDDIFAEYLTEMLWHHYD